MAGLSRDYNTNMVQLGPGDVWLNVELPATGAKPVITAAADGALTPDGTASASGIHLGMTEAGSKFTYTPTIKTYESDEQTAPIITALEGEAVTIEGSMLQVVETTIVTKLIMGGVRTRTFRLRTDYLRRQADRTDLHGSPYCAVVLGYHKDRGCGALQGL
jgi:hypothetical protein